MSTVKTVVAPFLCRYTMYSWYMYIIYRYAHSRKIILVSLLFLPQTHLFLLTILQPIRRPFFFALLIYSYIRILFVTRYTIYIYINILCEYMCSCALPGNGSGGDDGGVYMHIYTVQSCAAVVKVLLRNSKVERSLVIDLLSHPLRSIYHEYEWLVPTTAYPRSDARVL